MSAISFSILEYRVLTVVLGSRQSKIVMIVLNFTVYTSITYLYPTGFPFQQYFYSRAGNFLKIFNTF